MRYKKPPLSFEKQADLLLSRGLIADKDLLTQKLKDVNYYRLSAYLYPYRNPDDTYKPSTTLDKIWKHYTFDRQLRLLVLDSIERIEISIKTRLTTYFTCKNNSPFPHLQQKNFDRYCDIALIGNLVNLIRSNKSKSKETFVDHFSKKYKKETDLPLWMAVEIMSFGNIFTLFRFLKKHDQTIIAQNYDVPAKVFDSWLLCLNYIRNLCAHHSRLWNRELAIKPFIPRKNDIWQKPIAILKHQNRIFSVLTILAYLIAVVALQSGWKNRFKGLFNKYPDIPFNWMGFPEKWEECPIWK